MFIAQTWEPEAAYDITGGRQKIIERYNPAVGHYTSSYYKSPSSMDSVLAGLGAGSDKGFSPTAWWEKQSAMTQAILIAAVAAVGGYYGIKRYGSPKLKKMVGLSGRRSRR